MTATRGGAVPRSLPRNRASRPERAELFVGVGGVMLDAAVDALAVSGVTPLELRRACRRWGRRVYDREGERDGVVEGAPRLGAPSARGEAWRTRVMTRTAAAVAAEEEGAGGELGGVAPGPDIRKERGESEGRQTRKDVCVSGLDFAKGRLREDRRRVACGAWVGVEEDRVWRGGGHY
ncbi:hypothetical protein BJV77DRAFT_1123259 [Russula vinacea]|nr:hypothetical protein BJV77DRAFT_1123259 [Russula vinacea]